MKSKVPVPFRNTVVWSEGFVCIQCKQNREFYIDWYYRSSNITIKEFQVTYLGTQSISCCS
jgi:hypothetical protein